VAVATSGGRDSTALLHSVVRQARPLGIEVLALHVHHGLLPQADAWLAQVRTQSRRWGAAFHCRRLSGAPAKGQSVEAWARAERYAALAEMARAADCNLVLLAHHRRDQAETWLLQALRGAGPAGLSAMPRRAERNDLTWARPWLDQPPEAIQAYVDRHRIGHVEDPSNHDPRYARSRLRQQVWPALSQAFADAEQCLHAAAAHAQEDARLRAEVSALDLPSVSGPEGLLVAPWLALPPARRRVALRAWLQGQLAAVPETLVQRLSLEVPREAAGRWPAGQGDLRLHRGVLALHADAAEPSSAATTLLKLDLNRPGTCAVPAWGGSFVVRRARSGGVDPAHLCDVWARARQGGERFSLAPGATARSLKKQFQALAVPEWGRDGPLLFSSAWH
jgi:tRNA(Ile)-lysidine synthase